MTKWKPREKEAERQPTRACNLWTLRPRVVERIPLSSKVSYQGRENTILAFVALSAYELRDAEK